VPLFVALACGALAGCNDPGFTGTAAVREITAAEAVSCRYVTDVRMRPGVYGPLAQQGLEYARNRVLADVAQAGANAIVFAPVSPGAPVTEVTGTAYAC
jgi:hypothetical protein